MREDALGGDSLRLLLQNVDATEERLKARSRARVCTACGVPSTWQAAALPSTWGAFVLSGEWR